MTNQDRALRSAQTMHDRATDDRTDFSDWYESDHYALWLSDMTDALVAGRACWGFDKGSVLENVQHLSGLMFEPLTDVQKEAVNAHFEFCDATTTAEIMLRAGDDDYKNQKSLADNYFDIMVSAFRELAKQMAEEKAEAYYWQEVAK